MNRINKKCDYLMETHKWKKDETPYIVFTCSKCNQYIYVKTTQKTKKCLRCNHTHQVKKISAGELVKGMSTAVLTVKERQNELAIRELGNDPELRGYNDFCVTDKHKTLRNQEKENIEVKNLEDDNYLDEFREILIHLAKMHKITPIFLINMMTEEKMIPYDEVKFLMKKFENSGMLIPLKNNYYKIKIGIQQ